MRILGFIQLLLLPLLTFAQGNYIQNTVNNTTAGTYNTVLGPESGTALSGQATSNVFVGYRAGANTTDGFLNVFIGRTAGVFNSTGNYNVFTGVSAGAYNTTGSSNIFTGKEAGFFNRTGSGNVFDGNAAGYFNQSGSYNVMTGYLAGYNSGTGSYNVLSGYFAGYSNLGDGNIFIGNLSGYANAHGYSNVSVGNQASRLNQQGHNNVAIGDSAGYNSTSSLNVFVGSKAGFNLTSGAHNIIIGPNSGTALTNSDDNVLMGYNSQAEDGLHNAAAIGAGTHVAISNALILGNGVNVGIGTSAPANRLEVVSERQDQSGLRLTRLTTDSPAPSVTDQFLSVNEQGDVIKARYQLRISDASQWSDKVFSSSYRLRSLASVMRYINQHGHLPDIPSASEVVRAGVGLVKMNALLLEKIEELTLYSIRLEKANQQLDRKDQQLAAENKRQQREIEELKRLMKVVFKRGSIDVLK